ncbi:MtrAB system histidine kinase MtrB [Actinospica sp.]|jgi:two-component system sensor histidine kinase MtrB|uniref:MtrAB system histidine kinase MtrB n=1 Tax=Actinospica sp. TaxID=1872142 RepID=UPI002C12234F|nr:MtrAB system histidine kinase MtrB [Actinospica sp.]HWG23238.1 MtrAB system histidine kinase MtrB [Actinospica sp.]
MARRWRRWGAAALRLPGRVRSRWRRSLQFRVVAVTMVLSVIVAVGLGEFVADRVAKGLQATRYSVAQGIAESGFRIARTQLGSYSNGTVNDSANFTASAEQLFNLLNTGSADGQLYQVALEFAGDQAGVSAPYSSPRAFKPSAVPAALQEKIQTPENANQGFSQYYTLTETSADGSGQISVPAVLFAERVSTTGGLTADVYYVFPLRQDQQTLNNVEESLLLAGLVLVLALAVIAWFVTRQVVTPVRMAAAIAERLAAGRLDEQMRVRGEDDLASLATSFNKMAMNLQSQIRRLEELSRMQRRFVSDVSHELRTPLTTVRMAADLIHDAREDFDPTVARSAELLQTQLDRFEELLADLLEISRFDAGAAVLDAEPVDLRVLTQKVVDGAEPLAENKGSRVVTRFPDRPALAEVDTRRIDRILRNLVVNAIEHGEGKDVVISIAADEDAVAVSVRDYGVGLRPGESSLVFNRFWRADPARARTTGGTGLGLSIALEDAKLHRGWLQAWGEPGGGTQFRLTVPRTVGTELLHSPIRLEPEDSQHHQRHRRLPAAAAPRGLVRSAAVAAIAPSPGDSSSRIERYPNTFVLPPAPVNAPEPRDTRDEEE